MEIMKYVLFSLTLVFSLGVAQKFEFSDADVASDESLTKLYDTWRTAFKMPDPSPEEKPRKLEAFKANAKYVSENNKKDRGYKMKLNKFADMPLDEFKGKYTGSLGRHHRTMLGVGDGGDKAAADQGGDKAAPAGDVDWRTKNAVTPVKDQAGCGCAWAFATVGSVESLHAIQTKELVKLSEQQLIDCDTAMNKGCSGGVTDYAFNYIKKSGGLAKDETYPYTGAVISCNADKAGQVAATIDGYKNLPIDDEAALEAAVAKQPVVVSIDVQQDFQFYSEGVFTGDCQKIGHHAVLVVGYGSADGKKFWIVKNSWGTEWGEEGFARMEKGIPDKAGICGITLEACYPTKNDAGQAKQEF